VAGCLSLGASVPLQLPGRQRLFLSVSRKIDFQNATQPFLTQGFGVSKEAYFADHNTTLNCVRAKLLPKNLAQFHTPKLIQRFRQIWKEEWGNSGSGDLLAMIKHAVFWSSCDILFAYHDSQQNKIPKTGKLQQNKNKNKNENKNEDENENEDENKNEQAKDINSQKTEDELFFRAFENFDEDFELASSGIPHLLLRRFVRSKKYLLHRLGKVAQFYEALQSVEAHNNSTHPPKDMLLGKELLEKVRDKNGASWLLAILWAAEANTIPAIFWILCFILSHPEHHRQVVQEIDDQMEKFNGELTYEFFDSLKKLGNCVQETLRLRAAPIIVRATVQPSPIGKYIVPKGHFLCLSPLWTHRDPALYKHPNEFRPERWEEENIKEGKGSDIGDAKGKEPTDDEIKQQQQKISNKRSVVDRLSFISFGAGKYRCPGKFFAYHEMIVFVSLLLWQYELWLEDAKVPDQNWVNLVGVPKPVGTCRFGYRLRKARS
jgi:hypothetical protein